MDLIKKLNTNPIIAAIKKDSDLTEALNSEVEIVFILKSTILTVKELVEKIKQTGKMVFVHIDLIDGLSATIKALEFLIKTTNLDGIISTKSNMIKEAKKRNLLTIQRFFILDSLSYKNSLKYARETNPDIVEILPGPMPKIVRKFLYNYNCSIIASGMIMDKEDVISVLKAGAIGISTTKSEIWKL